ncbi:MAG: tetratricopeptide repeat protein [Phycisphaerales bacterium]|nr:tetratricopeptide repeat protein [Phycisphaerae bacterium]NNM27119.1 tetratricopeptide repeat protein [Phycisphaerales bacterium]
MKFDPQSNRVPDTDPAIATQTPPDGGFPWGPLLLGFVVLLGAGAGWFWITAPPDHPLLEPLRASRAVATTPAPAVTADPLYAGPIPAPAEGWTRLHKSAQAREAVDQAREMMAVGRYADALPHLEDAVTRDPASSDAHYNLGLAYVRLGRHDDARRETERLRALDPNLANMLANLTR